LMLFMAIVTTIETIGDISATTMGGANREATDKELSGGIMADGLGTAFGSIFMLCRILPTHKMPV